MRGIFFKIWILQQEFYFMLSVKFGSKKLSRIQKRNQPILIPWALGDVCLSSPMESYSDGKVPDLCIIMKCMGLVRYSK